MSKGEEKSKKGKIKSAVQQHTSRTFDSPTTKAESASGALGASGDDAGDGAVPLQLVLDAAGHLVELRVQSAPAPRLLLKLLALCAPYQPHLARLALCRAPLPAAALHELARLLPHSHVTELCLDDAPAPHCDYELLLETASQLRNLSLARCQLDDAACAALAARLAHPRPASRTLALLALPANRIGDVGAAALAQALRSNRTLLYLNLCGNQLSDDGAAALFRSLMEFPLTYDELVAKRMRLLEHLKIKEELYKQCYSELSSQAAERTQEDASRGGKRKTLAVPASARGRKSSAGTLHAPGDTAQRAHALATELLGAPCEPFSLEETVVRDQYVHSLGNSTLCALNLAYNNLSYCSLPLLHAALQQQAACSRRGGLLRVQLDGNALADCALLRSVHDLLESALSHKLTKPHKKPERAPKAKSK